MTSTGPNTMIAELASNIALYTGCREEDALALARQFFEQLRQEYARAGLVYGAGELGLMRWMAARLTARDESMIAPLSERVRGITLGQLAAY